MLRRAILEGLQYSLVGVDESKQNIFRIFVSREEVEFKDDEQEIEQEKATKSEEGEENAGKQTDGGAKKGKKSIKDNERRLQKFNEVESNLEVKNDAVVSEHAVVLTQENITTTILRRNQMVLVLTDEGARFFNTLLMLAHATRADQIDADFAYKISEFENPNIRLTNEILNNSRRVYYNDQARIDGKDQMISFDSYEDVEDLADLNYELNREGRFEIMDPEEYKRVWQRIFANSKVLNRDTAINVKLNKSIKYNNDIKAAYGKDGAYHVKYGQEPNMHERFRDYLLQPTWKFDYEYFTQKDDKRRFSDADIREWLMTSNKSGKFNNNKNSNKRNSNNQADGNSAQ